MFQELQVIKRVKGLLNLLTLFVSRIIVQPFSSRHPFPQFYNNSLSLSSSLLAQPHVAQFANHFFALNCPWQVVWRKKLLKVHDELPPTFRKYRLTLNRIHHKKLWHPIPFSTIFFIRATFKEMIYIKSFR